MDKKEKKYLGIDWGEKRIGLALGDSLTRTATPFKIVENIQDVVKVVKEEEIDVVVIGEPLKMSDIKYPLSEDFLNFFQVLKKELKIPIEKVDERLSSLGADALSGSKKTKAPRDTVAAMLILQNYLDKHNSN
ncbi:MAG: Holliday junction resolvase RuvX [Patescibacteria group bacterium]|jgi:putative Holliday junction resolvase